MTSEDNQFTLGRFTQRLEETSELANELLNEVKKTETDFAVLKSELDNVREKIKNVYKVLEGSDGETLATKIALIEQKVKGIQDWLGKHQEKHSAISKENKKIQETLESLKNRVSLVEQELKLNLNAKEKKDQIAVENKKALTKVKAEKYVAAIKIIVAIIVAGITIFMWFQGITITF